MDLGRVIVIGTGISGIAASKLLKTKGFDVVLYDGNKNADAEDIKKKLKDSGAPEDIEIKIGGLDREYAGSFKTGVLSPGVPLDSDDAKSLFDAGVKVIGEIELAYLFSKGKVCAITGTNGKTTTTALTGELLKTTFPDTRVVGNIGIPYTDMLDDMTEDTRVVAEISSFQLETADTFAPKVCAILNITPDHLNRHHTMEEYIKAKKKIAKNAETVVLNYEDECLADFGDDLLSDTDKNIIFFSSRTKLAEGYFLDGDVICRCIGGKKEDIIHVDELNIIGRHNYENVMAAIAMADYSGVSRENIIKALKNFKAVSHRIEFVEEIGGVKFYDDSKGTNPDAAIQAVRAMKSPTYLIGGGYDKGSDYVDWIRSFGGMVKKLYLLGATKEKIASDCDECGFKDYVFVKDLKEAVDRAFEEAKPGENVLLSPACASWDMFKSYEQRGDMFKEMVRERL